MKKLVSTLLIMIFLSIGDKVFADQKISAPRIVTEKNGMYIQKDIRPYFDYMVDSVAELCFAKSLNHGVGLTQIDCKNLSRRPEWKSIITWVDK